MHSEFIFDTALSTAVAPNGKRHAQLPAPKGPLAADMLDKMDRYRRAASYLCTGRIYLFENPLLREPLVVDMFGRKLGEDHDYIRRHPEDMPEIKNRRWTADFSELRTPV